MIFARALFFAISIVLSSSGDFSVVPRADARMLRQGNGGSAVEPSLERRGVRVLHSKSAKSKSSKVGSKSGSKGSKSKAAKSKSGKSKSSKAKSSKTKSSKTKSAKSISYSKIETVKKKSGSEKSVYNNVSEDSFDLESSNDYKISSSDPETENIALPAEDLTAVVTHAASMETSSVVYDNMHVEGDPAQSSASGNVTSNDDNHSIEGMEKMVGSPGSNVTTSSSDGFLSNRTDDVMMHVENKIVQGAANLEVGFEDERIAEGTNEDENHENGSSDSSSQEEIDGITYDSSGDGEPQLGQVSTGVTNLESELIETKIGEDETIEKFVQTEADFDPSRESLE